MAKIKQVNAEGVEEEIEVFTPEEVTAQIDAVKNEYDTKIAEKDTTLSTLANEKAELEKKIGGVKEDAPNFKILKDALDKKDADIASLREEVTKDKTARKDSFINSLIAKADDETKKKIKLHLDTTLAGLKADTDEEIKNKVDAAIKLSQDTNSQGIFDGGIGGDGKGEGFKQGGGESVEFTAREKAIGEKLGLTAEDYKKYGPRLKNKI
jgi:hypothetical protein